MFENLFFVRAIRSKWRRLCVCLLLYAEHLRGKVLRVFQKSCCIQPRVVYGHVNAKGGVHRRFPFV